MNPMDFPLLVFILSLVALALASFAGEFVRRHVVPFEEKARTDFNLVLGALLTLLSLLIGFTFSMAISRYDLRKNYEEGEANAIGTEYVRADLLPAENAAVIRTALKRYVDQRILFYTTWNSQRLAKIAADTAELQNQLWSAVHLPPGVPNTPSVALAISGMNDVLNSEGYTQAAWWNRIPTEAWLLMAGIAVICHFLIGYGAAQTSRRLLFLILPIAVSIAFFLIADIDCPGNGEVRVVPQNLIRLADSLRAN